MFNAMVRFYINTFLVVDASFGLFGGRLYVQIHYAIYYPSDLEHEYDL